MAKVKLITELLIDTDDYSVVQGYNKGCEGCPFFKVAYCSDIFHHVFGGSCLYLKATPSSSAKNIKKTTVLVDGKELTLSAET